MIDNERHRAVYQLIHEYVQSPSLRHLRDLHAISKIARQIILAIDREPSVWRKWQGEREGLLRSAAECWVPLDDLREFLNSLPGPPLTLTDVAQRLRAIHEEAFSSYPNEELRERCEELYARERAAGTELPAIIGALQEFVEVETQRINEARDAAWRRRQMEERAALEERFLAGADCGWTPIQKSKDLYMRRNGRAYRLSPTKEKRWELSRIDQPGDTGTPLGIYGTRTDVNKALKKLAYEPEPRW